MSKQSEAGILRLDTAALVVRQIADPDYENQTWAGTHVPHAAQTSGDSQ